MSGWVHWFAQRWTVRRACIVAWIAVVGLARLLPPLYVGPVEVAWIAVGYLGTSITSYLLLESIRDRRYVMRLNGKARLIAVSGDVRREVLRLISQTLLLTVAIPGLFVDREIPLSWPIVALMAVPCVLCLQSALDVRERRRLLRLLRS